MKMTDEQYAETQKEIISLGAQVRTLNLTGFLDRIANAENVGPIIDPTLYRNALARIQAIKELARALLPVKLAHEKLAQIVVTEWVSSLDENSEPHVCQDPNCTSDTNHPEHL